MKRKKPIAKNTVARKIRKKVIKRKVAKKPSAEARKQNATTMQIPVDAIFDDLATDHTTHLKVTIPGKQPFTAPLDDHETVIGRDSGCAVYLPIDNASREHARSLRNGEQFSIEDLNSTNGTLVNNVRVIRCNLHHSDQIQIGLARMTIVRVNQGDES